MKSVFIFGFFLSIVIASISAITQQEFIALAGTVAAGISLIVMAVIPLYSKIREAILKADVASSEAALKAEIAAREARKADCEYALECMKELNSGLAKRIATLERECTEWQELYRAGSARDRTKVD